MLPLWSRIGNVFGGIGFGNGPSLVNIYFTTPGFSTEAVQNAAASGDAAINFTGNNNYDECEAGNEPYTGAQQLDSPPGLQSKETLITDAAARRARACSVGGPADEDRGGEVSRRAPGAAAEERRYLRVAAIATVVLLLVTVGVFIKDNPFAGAYEIKGVFTTSNQLRSNSAVRIGGLDVGKVVKIEAGDGNTSVVTMEITDRDVPIRADADLAIEPRLVLEGNFYVKVSPGSPGAAELADGGTIPLSRTSVPVQLDQVLGVLDEPTRTALQGTFREFAIGLGPKGDSGGWKGLRDSIAELDRALGSATRVSRAAQGTRPGDLRRAIRDSGAVTEQLASSPAALAGLVASYSRVSGALAARDQALGATVRGFDQVVREAPPNLAAVNAALPVLTEFAQAAAARAPCGSRRPAQRERPARSASARRARAGAARPDRRPRAGDRRAPGAHPRPAQARDGCQAGHRLPHEQHRPGAEPGRARQRPGVG